MDYCLLDDENWNQLIYAIRQKRCILMLGPDAAVESPDTEPLSALLSKELAEKIKDDIPQEISRSNFVEIAQYYQIKKGRIGLESYVEQFYERYRAATGEIHSHLSELPFSMTIMSTPDQMMINALKKRRKEPVVANYSFKGKKSDVMHTGTEEKPMAFQLYGSTESPESLVMTETDLLDFLVSVISKNPELPSCITSELHSPNKNFLFLGFGFKHWYLRVLLHVLSGNGNKQSRSFALECMPKNTNEFNRVILFYSKNHKCNIHIFHDELHEFVKTLKEKYDRRAGCAVPVSEGPSVFICHAKADEPHAEWLYKEFRNAGFQAFLDKESVEPGIDWDRMIERRINKTDFFVVLKSKALEKRPEGYVNKEIGLALERQKYFDPVSPFIIPVKIEECEPVWDDELGRFQDADLTDRKNIIKLISAIKRHNERRKKARA